MRNVIGGPVLEVLARHRVDVVECFIRQLEGLTKFTALMADKGHVNIKDIICNTSLDGCSVVDIVIPPHFLHICPDCGDVGEF